MRFFLIKWKGWSNKHNTWEPTHNLSCYELITCYEEVNKLQPNGVVKKIERNTDTLDDEKQATNRTRILDLTNQILCSNQNDLNNQITPLKILDHESIFLAADAQALRKSISGTRTKRISKLKRKLGVDNRNGSYYKRLKKDSLIALKEWEKEINRINCDPAKVVIENNVDAEGPPANFTYIAKCFAGKDVTIPDDPIVGCECECCATEQKTCCGHRAGSSFAYYKLKPRVRLEPGHFIFECNKRCACDSQCSNRVVQHGRKVPLAIFRTKNAKGWGVKTLKRIPKGTFIMEYVGEVSCFCVVIETVKFSMAFIVQSFYGE